MAEQAYRITGFDELAKYEPEKAPICYWKDEGIWYLYLPHCGLGNLKNHTVEEHEDGTITASPSILVTAHGGAKRHGFLRRGLWEEC